MNKQKPPTSTQPQLVKGQRIYGSTPVKPIDSANQPEVLSNTKVYGQRQTATIRVKLKAGGKTVIINAADFDETQHKRLDA